MYYLTLSLSFPINYIDTIYDSISPTYAAHFGPWRSEGR